MGGTDMATAIAQSTLNAAPIYTAFYSGRALAGTIEHTMSWSWYCFWAGAGAAGAVSLWVSVRGGTFPERVYDCVLSSGGP